MKHQMIKFDSMVGLQEVTESKLRSFATSGPQTVKLLVDTVQFASKLRVTLTNRLAPAYLTFRYSQRTQTVRLETFIH